MRLGAFGRRVGEVQAAVHDEVLVGEGLAAQVRGVPLDAEVLQHLLVRLLGEEHPRSARLEQAVPHEEDEQLAALLPRQRAERLPQVRLAAAADREPQPGDRGLRRFGRCRVQQDVRVRDPEPAQPPDDVDRVLGRAGQRGDRGVVVDADHQGPGRSRVPHHRAASGPEGTDGLVRRIHREVGTVRGREGHAGVDRDVLDPLHVREDPLRTEGQQVLAVVDVEPRRVGVVDALVGLLVVGQEGQRVHQEQGRGLRPHGDEGVQGDRLVPLAVRRVAQDVDGGDATEAVPDDDRWALVRVRADPLLDEVADVLAVVEVERDVVDEPCQPSHHLGAVLHQHARQHVAAGLLEEVRQATLADRVAVDRVRHLADQRVVRKEPSPRSGGMHEETANTTLFFAHGHLVIITVDGSFAKPPESTTQPLPRILTQSGDYTNYSETGIRAK